jgi:hypothetical protein
MVIPPAQVIEGDKVADIAVYEGGNSIENTMRIFDKPRPVEPRKMLTPSLAIVKQMARSQKLRAG